MCVIFIIEKMVGKRRLRNDFPKVATFEILMFE